MKKEFLVVAFVALTSNFASANDLPVRSYAKPLPQVGGWKGFYAGANFGYGWQDPSFTFTPTDDNGSTIINGGVGNLSPLQPPTSFNVSGAAGGVQAGYNHQIDQRWLAGVEADFNFSGIKGQNTTTFFSGGLPPFQFTALASEKVKWFGTARARVGYLPTRDLLVFGTGGLAYGEVEHSASFVSAFPVPFAFNQVICFPGTPCYIGASSRIAAGWTLGGGFEYALMRNWTVKAEYLYVNLGRDSFPLSATVSPSGPSTITASVTDTTFNLVRIGGNYRF